MEHQEEDKTGLKHKQLTIKQKVKTQKLNLNANRKNNIPASHDAKLHVQPGFMGSPLDMQSKGWYNRLIKRIIPCFSS